MGITHYIHWIDKEPCFQVLESWIRPLRPRNWKTIWIGCSIVHGGPETNSSGHRKPRLIKLSSPTTYVQFVRVLIFSTNVCLDFFLHPFGGAWWIVSEHVHLVFERMYYSFSLYLNPQFSLIFPLLSVVSSSSFSLPLFGSAFTVGFPCSNVHF